MPIYLQVEPRLDDHAARQTADKAKRYYSDAGKDVGAEFTKQLTSGLNSSDAAFRKSAENAEKAFRKAADAAGATRVEEAKLDDLRSKGTGATALLAQTERLEKARRSESTTTRTAVAAMRELDDAHMGAANSGTILAGVLQGIAQGASNTRIGGLAASIEGIGTKGILAAAGIGVLGAGIGATVKGLYDLGSTWDNISDSITGRTGKMGTDLAGVVNTVKEVGRQSAVSLEGIAQLAGGVAQNLHLSGAEATAMTQKLADIQQVTSQAVNTRDLGKAFRLFDITDAQSEIDTLGQLTAASQRTDVPINDLITNLNSTGRASHEAGLNLQQTLGVLLTLEEAGVSFDSAGTSLTMAMRNWAKEGRDSNVALGETIAKIKELIANGNEAGAQALAAASFGKTGWTDLFAAIKDGTLDAKNLEEALKKLGDTKNLIDNEKKSTEDWTEALSKLWHGLSDDLGPTAAKVFNGINTALEWGSRGLRQAQADAQNLATTVGSIKLDPALAALMGVPLPPPGAPAAAPAGPGLPTTRPGTPTTGLAPNFYKDWYKTPEELKKEQAEQSKLPTAPAVAYDTSLPPGYAGVPQTSEIVGAENSWMDARHTLAEKQARLTQLEGDTNAKEDDKIKAKNDVINAQQAQNQAELRLLDARTSLYAKENKALKDHTDALGEFGAKLDQDFGISKGLPGIAENLTKFLGNLIAAPFLSEMNAIANAPGQAQGGSGLMGILGAKGVFGPQYTAAGQAAASGTSSATAPKAVLGPNGVSTYAPGGGGGYTGDAALLSNVPAGRYTQTEGADLTKGLADCSSAVEDLVNLMDGAPTAGRSMSTGNEADWLTQHGFMPGMGGPGDFRVGFNSEHTQATLPGGTPFNWGSDAAAANRGIGGTGADDPAFTSHFYRPGGGAPGGPGGGAPGGPGGGTSSLSSASGVVPVFVTNMGGGGMGGGAPVGSPASGQGTGRPPGAGGGSGLSPEQWNKIMGAEAGPFGWEANTGNGFSGGLQFAPQTWNAYKPPGAPDQAYLATPDQQMAAGDATLAAQGPGAWPATSAAHPDWFQQGLPPLGGPGMGGPMSLGGPMPQGVGPGAFAANPAGPSGAGAQIGGVEPPSNKGGGQLGMTSGGTLDTALGLASSGLDLLAPGAGQAAQMGIKLANRAIQFGGQAAGIGVQGALDTFIPWGGSELASKNWITRIVGGLAGAAPALPNMAGKPAAKPDQGKPGQGQPGGDGSQGPTFNTTINNQRATEDGTGKDFEHHMTATNLGAGM